MAQFPNPNEADGIWTLKQVRRNVLGGTWKADEFQLPSNPANIRGFELARDGSTFYIPEYLGVSSESNFYMYTMATPFTLNTATYSGVFTSHTGGTSQLDLAVSHDGTVAKALGYNGNAVATVWHSATTPFDFTTATKASDTVTKGTRTTGNFGNSDLSSFYVLENAVDGRDLLWYQGSATNHGNYTQHLLSHQIQYATWIDNGTKLLGTINDATTIHYATTSVAYSASNLSSFTQVALPSGVNLRNGLSYSDVGEVLMYIDHTTTPITIKSLSRSELTALGI